MNDNIIKRIDEAVSIPDLFFQTVASDPEGIVAYQPLPSAGEAPSSFVSSTNITVAQRVRLLADHLVRAGLKKGDRVAILSLSRPEWMEADLAILCAGGVSVGIYQTLPADDIGYILHDSGCRFVFAENEEQLQKLNVLLENPTEIPEIEDRAAETVHIKLEQIILFEESDIACPRAKILSFGSIVEQDRDISLQSYQDLSREDLAALVYTSGTTGAPKGVMQTHGNHLANVRQAWQAEICGDASKILVFLPLAHSFARLMGYLTYLTPAIAHFPGIFDTKTSRLDPAALTKDIREADTHIVPIVPRLLEKMRSVIQEKARKSGIQAKLLQLTLWAARKNFEAKQQEKAPSMLVMMAYEGTVSIRRQIRERLFGTELRYCVSGGAKLGPDVATFFEALGIEVLQGYGLTETCVATNVNRSGRNKIGTVGPVLAPDIEVKIAADDEILFRGPNVTSGYYRRPEATKESWDQDGWFHTGDLGALDEDGYLSIVGRKKDILVSSYGKNIAPDPIQSQVRNSPYISQAVLIGDGRPYCVMIVTLDAPNVETWLRSKKLSIPNESLECMPEVQTLIEKEITRVNEDLARYESIKRFVIVPGDFTVENGLLTPTFKVKRKPVLEKYAGEIEELYQESS